MLLMIGDASFRKRFGNIPEYNKHLRKVGVYTSEMFCCCCCCFNKISPKLLCTMTKPSYHKLFSHQKNFFTYFQYRCFGLVSLFNGISTFVDYLMSKPSLKKDNSGTHSRRDRELHNFPKGISPKVDIVRLEFELVYYKCRSPLR